VGQDVWRLVADRARLDGDRTFLTWQPFDGEPRTWTYAELHDQALQVAAGLQARGVGAGDRVLIHLENCPEFLLAWFGCAALHAVAVTTNARASADELAYFIADSGARWALTQPAYARLVAQAGPELELVASTADDPGLAEDPGLPEAAAGPVEGVVAFADLLGDPAGLALPDPDPAAPLSIQYTSGTTARPKGVLWTQANGLWAGRVNAAHEGLVASDCQLVYMPLFHTNAMAYSVLASMWVGARVVLVHKWSTSRFWELSVAHGCTFLSLMGLSLRTVLGTRAPEGHSYRCFGGPLVADFRTPFGVDCIAWWGMTETVSHPVHSGGLVDPPPRTIGRPASEYDVEVRHPDGTPVKPGETGELVVRGVPGLSMFAEYWNNPEATAAAYDEHGWFATGDLVRVEADGSMSFVDRLKDMLKVGAENVAASEIERVVATVPGVAEAAVVGRPDASLDEVPVVVVVPVDGLAGADLDTLPERVRATCAELLADFKVPRAVHVVRALPRSTISKVNKAELRRTLGDHGDADEALARAEAGWAAAQVRDPSGDEA